MSIPAKQQAAVKHKSEPRCEVVTADVPELKPGHILCKINYSGVCGTDKNFIYDEWKPLGITMSETTKGIAGHEGAGTVVAVAEDVKDLWKEGDRVGIKWVASICQRCEFCTNGLDEMLCPHRKTSGTSVPGESPGLLRPAVC